MAGTRRTLSPLPINYRLMLVKTSREIVVGRLGVDLVIRCSDARLLQLCFVEVLLINNADTGISKFPR